MTEGVHVRRIARWTSAIAVAVLTVLTVGVLCAGGATAGEPPAPVGQESSHGCHGAPLQDIEHAAASPVRLADDGTSASTVDLTVLCVRTVPAAVVRPAVPDDTPPAPARVSTADLQVFRI
jgi:hypothetical protein